MKESGGKGWSKVTDRNSTACEMVLDRDLKSSSSGLGKHPL